MRALYMVQDGPRRHARAIAEKIDLSTAPSAMERRAAEWNARSAGART